MKKLSNYFLILTTTLTTIQALQVKRQVADNPDTRPTVSDRYGFLGGAPGFFNQPFNPNNFGFNIFGSNPFLSQFFPQNQFVPQNGNSISQSQPQNQQFRPQNQQFQPQSQPNFQNRPQNRPQIPQNRPQQNQQFQPQNQQQVVSTTVSPQVQACTESCIESTAGQYNPVCGSNNETYHNQERFDCAVECGQNLRVIQRGMCPRPTASPWQTK